MTAEDKRALELEQEVLPVRGDALESPAVETRRHARRACPRMKRLDLDLLPCERGERTGGAMKGVSLGHSARGAGSPAAGRR